MEQWRSAIKLRPDLADAWAALGTVEFSSGHKMEGLADLKHALTIEALYSSPDYLKYEAFWSAKLIGFEQEMIGLLNARK